MERANHRKNTRHTCRKNPREGDWVCHMCHNYNYSFRSICNRCSASPHSYPQYPPSHYHYTPTSTFQVADTHEQGFPTYLFLMLEDEQSQEQQHSCVGEGLLDAPNMWIQQLIED